MELFSVRKRFITLFSIIFLRIVGDEMGTCELDKDNGSNYKLSFNFSIKNIGKRVPFTVKYLNSNGHGEGEMILNCDWLRNRLECDRAKGYSYSQPEDRNFTVYIQSSFVKHGGQYILSFVDNGNVKCEPKQSSNVSNTVQNKTEQVLSTCDDGSMPYVTNGTIGLECPSNDKTSNIGVIIFSVCAIVLTVAAVIFVCLKRGRKSKKKEVSKEKTDPEKPDIQGMKPLLDENKSKQKHRQKDKENEEPQVENGENLRPMLVESAVD